MRFPDTNVLIYSVNTDSAQHETAKRWLIEAFDEVGGIGLSWNTLLGFIRITTHPAILGRPLRVEQALQTIQVWLTHPSAQILTPLDGHAALLDWLGAPQVS